MQDGWQRRRDILLSEYERVALELFAARGFHNVTVDDIAAAAGVTTRTLFRYFPSKQDCLLGFHRRALAAEVDLIDSLEPSDDPLTSAWEGIRAFVSGSPVEPDVVDLLSAAAKGAPEVVARVRGERIDAIFQALVSYFERCLGVRHDDDPRPRLFAGVLAGIELALVESIPQAPGVVDGLFEHAADAVRDVAQAIAAGAGPGRRSRPLRR